MTPTLRQDIATVPSPPPPLTIDTVADILPSTKTEPPEPLAPAAGPSAPTNAAAARRDAQATSPEEALAVDPSVPAAFAAHIVERSVRQLRRAASCNARKGTNDTAAATATAPRSVSTIRRARDSEPAEGDKPETA